jgi:hypothetical protein
MNATYNQHQAEFAIELFKTDWHEGDTVTIRTHAGRTIHGLITDIDEDECVYVRSTRSAQTFKVRPAVIAQINIVP